MMPSENTNIGWCDGTWSPTHGCSKVSEGCQNCYAARISQRYGHTEKEWTAENAEENVRLQEHHLDWPRNQSDPMRIFVNSMSDLFHEQVPFDYLHRVFDVIEDCPEHVFIALTKHGCENGRLSEWDYEHGRWPENLWMGVSVESDNRKYRIQNLAQTGAETKWISFEPLVERVRMGALDLERIDWAVIGGESGSDDDRREMNHAWAREIRDAARATATTTPVYFKQSSGRKQGHLPVLAEAGSDPREARWQGADTTTLRELPELTDELRQARPDLAEQEVRSNA